MKFPTPPSSAILPSTTTSDPSSGCIYWCPRFSRPTDCDAKMHQHLRYRAYVTTCHDPAITSRRVRDRETNIAHTYIHSARIYSVKRQFAGYVFCHVQSWRAIKRTFVRRRSFRYVRPAARGRSRYTIASTNFFDVSPSPRLIIAKFFLFRAIIPRKPPLLSLVFSA